MWNCWENTSLWTFLETVALGNVARTKTWDTCITWTRTPVLTWSTETTDFTSHLRMPFVKTMSQRKFSILFNSTQFQFCLVGPIIPKFCHHLHLSMLAIMILRKNWQSFFTVYWEMSLSSTRISSGGPTTTSRATWVSPTTAPSVTSWCQGSWASTRCTRTCSSGWSEMPSVSTSHPGGG